MSDGGGRGSGRMDLWMHCSWEKRNLTMNDLARMSSVKSVAATKGSLVV